MANEFTLCGRIGGSISMAFTMMFSGSALVSTWWTGPAQEATLWKYRVGMGWLKKDFDWQDVCSGLQVIGDVESACSLIYMVRLAAGLALLFSVTSFIASVWSICWCSPKPSKDLLKSNKVAVSIACWTALICFIFTAGAAAS